jgi:hypothetical protein
MEDQCSIRSALYGKGYGKPAEDFQVRESTVQAYARAPLLPNS